MGGGSREGKIIAYVGFGSNLGDREGNFRTAERLLSLAPGVSGVRASQAYLTEPLTTDGRKEPWYLNAVFRLVTGLSATALFRELKRTERAMGREPAARWAPRTADLDLLFYGDVVYDDGELRVPHSGVSARRFVLQPLCDLAPELKHPEFGMTASELLKACDDPLRVVAYWASLEAAC